MTSGSRTPEAPRPGAPARAAPQHRHGAIGLVARAFATAMLWSLAPPAWCLELPELLRLLAQHSSTQARFDEVRQVSGLDKALTSSGTLSFRAPDRLERITELPRPERFVVEGERVTIERGGRRRQMMLDTVPELAAFVAALRGTLAGDAAALRRHFQTSVSGSAASWTITLQPLEPQLVSGVRQLRLEGRQGELRQLELQLADGDRSLTTIEPIAPRTP